MKLITLSSLFLVLALSACSQNIKTDSKAEENYAKSLLRSALSEKGTHNLVDKKTIIIKDSSMATAIAEPILFNIYKKENIIAQRPYQIHNIDNYWILQGTLKEGYKGGCFLIIIDSRTCEIIQITHGK